MERELWKALSWLTVRLNEGGPSWRYSTADILVVHFWAVVNDPPTRAAEGCFGVLTCIGGGLAPLPAWVRRSHRVRNWVHANLLAADAPGP